MISKCIKVNAVNAIIHFRYFIRYQPFKTCYPLKGHTYLNTYVCMTFLSRPGVKGLALVSFEM